MKQSQELSPISSDQPNRHYISWGFVETCPDSLKLYRQILKHLQKFYEAHSNVISM